MSSATRTGVPLAAWILVTLAAAAGVTVAYPRWPRAAYAAAIAVPGVAFVAFVVQLPAVGRDAGVAETWAWVPSLGVEASFRIDGLALLFALAITGVGALILTYVPPYHGWRHDTGKLLGLLLVFLASMLGLVLADDAITMFVFWELTSVSSFFLIGMPDTATARARARQALLVTSGGGLALLLGLLLLAHAAAPGAGLSVPLSTLAAADVRGHASYSAIVILVAIGAFTKSAQVPFHFWLPGAMVAPAPVSAYLHSATMVKAGIYVLARVHPALGDTTLWTGLLGTVGAITFVVGALLATLQRELKLALAYATVATLGALTMLLGLGTDGAIAAAIVVLAAHVAYKAALFLAAGNLDHQLGIRDPFAGRGALRELPITTIAVIAAAASMAGVPPLVGFIAKDALLAAQLGAGSPVWLAPVLIAGVALVAVAWLVGYAPFLRRPRAPGPARDAPIAMLIGPLVLAGFGLAASLFPAMLLEPLATAAASAVAGREVTAEIALWHGTEGVYGLALGLGLASLLAGSLAYLALDRGRETIAAVRLRLGRIAAGRGYDVAMRALERGAVGLTRILQHGRLHGYITTIVAVVVVAAGLPVLARVTVGESPATVFLGLYEAPLAVLVFASMVAATAFRDRYAAVAALATGGFGVSFLFALFSAPDLAITQLVVETMLLILLVLVVRRLPRDAPPRRARLRIAQASLAGIAGALMATLLLIATTTTGFEPEASRAQIELARIEHSENVVNTILVNFRAIDTLGEILVLAVAGLGVASLLTLWRR
jgi:multicomponent Na+:H+ antiporter subunit A